MPAGFFYPNEVSEFWVPLAFTKFQLQNSASLFTVTGRLRDGITNSQAQADLETIRSQLAQNQGDRNRGKSVFLVPLRDLWFAWIRQPLVTLEGAVILVLLIACANVSTLLLAHLPSRQPEVAVRLLMGASRGRIIRQFLTEGLALSLAGGTIGLAVAMWGMRSLAGLHPPASGVSISPMTLDGGLIAIVVLLSMISCLLFGFIPAVVAFSSGTDLKQMTVHRRRGRLAGVLVSVQVGLALVLLVSSGLLINSFVRLILDDRGFNSDGMLTFQYRVPLGDYLRNLTSYHGMPAMEIKPPIEDIRSVHEKLMTLPGIESVAGASVPPVNVIVPPTATVLLEGKPVPASADERASARVVYYLVTDNYFETMHTPVLNGRAFDRRDARSSPWVAVINEAMANRFWPGEDPIGKRFTVDAVAGEQPREVIGIVRDVGLRYIRTGPPEAVAYSLYLQQSDRYEGFNANAFGQMTFFMRSNQNPIVLESTVRRAIAEVDPARPLSNFQTMEEYVGDGLRTRRYNASALSGFALMATILAAVGVYGVMSSSVSQRTREIGIHMAMGAGSRDIVRLVGARAIRLIAIGLTGGFLAALLLTQLLQRQLWGITATDPLTFAAVIVLLIGVSLAACFIPARRAMRVDPAEALRMD
jgi:putative ABC transport system permease protein